MFLEVLRRCRYMQYVAAISATLAAASVGMQVTWSSPTLPKLTSDSSPIGVTITTEEGSWVASVFVLSMTLSAPFANISAELLGPKFALLFSALPTFVGWMLCIYANSAAILIVGRCVGGFGAGISVVIIPMYIGEISSKDIRGRLASLYNIVRLCGNLFVLTVGPYVSYEALTWSCSGVSVIFLFTFAFMPESPYYRAKKGDEVGAKKNLSRLSGIGNLDDQLQEIKFTIEHDFNNKGSCLDLITKKDYLFPLAILLVVKTTQQMCGLGAVSSYFQTIIGASHSSITPEVSSMIAGSVQLPTAILAMVLVEKLGRKVLFLTSGIACGLALTAEGVFFYIQNEMHGDLSSISWLPTTALILYLIMNSFGLNAIPYVLMSEMLSTNMKAAALSITMAYGGLTAFLVIKFFMPISISWGMHATFWMFAGFCFVGALCTHFALPETKGRTFDEIQSELKKRGRSLTCGRQ
ncbi:facilitated trehalose transporter Tret1-like [Photinus pyralis]|uniref:facilitated trehalose transporter Tret1-like n=1 Tax=Photinus pyralis TaxID=7054 RepID=UPI001266F4A9|nr:facilitated trehalose transporter Tret1-like [Photinus pyralis]